MRFLINVIDSGTNTANPNEIQDIDAFNEMLEANGHWIIACGIASPESSVLIDNRNDANIRESKPLHNDKEHVSGFWLIKADDQAQAEEIAAKGSKACNRRVEVRPIL